MSLGRESNPRMEVLQTPAFPLRHQDFNFVINTLALLCLEDKTFIAFQSREQFRRYFVDAAHHNRR